MHGELEFGTRLWMQRRVIAVARSLATAPPESTLQLDEEFDLIIGGMWAAACRGDFDAFKSASRRYSRRVLEVLNSADR